MTPEEPTPVVWPETLLKALMDPFDYLIVLRDGQQLRVNEVVRSTSEGFVFLKLEPDHLAYGHPCPRGLEVRVADIVACADAPDGS